MFETKIHIATFIYLTIQMNILSCQIVYYLSKPKDKARLRFLSLTLLFILYNLISGLVPDEQIPIEILFQNITAWIAGIHTAIYFLYFIYKEYNIRPIEYLKIKNIIYSVGIAFVILFLLPYITTKNLSLSRNIFLVLPLLLSIACLINIVLVLARDYIDYKNANYRFRIFCGGVGMMSIVSLPLTILLYGDNQLIEHSSFSLGYMLIAFSYIKRQIYNRKIEYELLEKLCRKSSDSISHKQEYIISLYGLTSKEKEIMLLIIEGLNYYEISKEIYLSEDIIIKYVSNIFRKINIKNRAELMSLVYGDAEHRIAFTKSHHKTEISKEITDEVLQLLNKFEEKKGFLKKNLNLKELARKTNTNTKYLSKIINDYKNLNFNGYINKLRIDHTIKMLNEDPKFRRYSIKHLAEEVGFNNAEVFSRAFRNNIEKKPSEYIKELLAEDN